MNARKLASSPEKSLYNNNKYCEISLINLNDKEALAMNEIIIMLIILVITIVLFVTEKIPIAFTALIAALAVYIFGIIDTDTFVGGLTNEVVLLIAGMFIIGGALFQTGVAAKVGALLTKYAKTEKQFLVILLLISIPFSMFLSNTSSVAVMLPIVILVADQSGYSRSKLLIPIAFLTSLVGMMTLIGTTSNLAVQSVILEAGLTGFRFFEFAWVGLPLTIFGVIYLLTLGRRLLPDLGPREISEEKKQRTYDFSGWNYKQVVAVIVLVLAIISMMLEAVTGIPLYITALVGAIILISTRTINEKQAYQSIDLSTLILLAAMIPVASAIEASGLGQMIADGVIGVVGDATSPVLIITIIFFITVLLGAVMSNTATALLMAPIAILIATNLGVSPYPLLMTVAMGAAASYLTPISTPPNTMVYVPGNYTFMNYVVVGVPLVLSLIHI